MPTSNDRPDFYIETVLAVLKNVGLAGFCDNECYAVYAHPLDVPRERVFDSAHMMIQWATDDLEQPHTYDRSSFRASLWEKEDRYFYEMYSIYATPVRQPFKAEAERCARAVAEWFREPEHTAGAMLLAALAEYGILPGSREDSDTYDVPVAFTRERHGHLSIADRSGTVQHSTSVHTGWSILLHDERGECVGDPVYISGDGRMVIDCAADSDRAAALVADWLTAPLSRHCDCYAQESHLQRHDPECNRYARPRPIVAAL
ncbi:hypothetical protein ACFVHW_04375 [Streptomyces sp. NPDC127110]|uniref:hypothetical protein n=1 Tax=Streptomyces sp. NPDC127110 TaxID=3345362 RepID=UPI00362B2757